MSLNKELETCFLFNNIQKSFKEGLKRIKPNIMLLEKTNLETLVGYLRKNLP